MSSELKDALIAAKSRVKANTNLDNIPAVLRSKQAWLHWCYEFGDPKPIKVPYYALGGRRQGANGSEADRRQWVAFAVARDQLARLARDGLGFTFAEDLHIIGVDFDKCVVDGVVDPEVEALLKGTYREYSPSREGVRAFYVGDMPGKFKLDAKDGKFGLQIFYAKGFVTITGDVLPSCVQEGTRDIVAELTPKFFEYCEKLFSKKSESAPPRDAWERKLVLDSADADTITDLRDALLNGLDQSRADTYDLWIDVGLALKSLDFPPFSDSVWTLWHEFSARSTKYEEGAAENKWNGLRPSGITYKSIFFTRNRMGGSASAGNLAAMIQETPTYWCTSPQATSAMCRSAGNGCGGRACSG